MTEQQQHLQNLLQQRNSLQEDLENGQRDLNGKRELILKIQGAIEYLSQIGVTLPEPEVAQEEVESSEEG